MGIEFNGVNGSKPVFGTNGSKKADKADKTFDFGFNSSSDMEVGLDTVQLSTKVVTQSDLDKMWEYAGITKPEYSKSNNDNFADLNLTSHVDLNTANFLKYHADLIWG